MTASLSREVMNSDVHVDDLKGLLEWKGKEMTDAQIVHRIEAFIRENMGSNYASVGKTGYGCSQSVPQVLRSEYDGETLQSWQGRDCCTDKNIPAGKAMDSRTGYRVVLLWQTRGSVTSQTPCKAPRKPRSWL